MPHEVSESTTEAMQAMKAALSKLETEEGRGKGLAFQPKADDVFIVTPPKCGTTWVQQIVHGLRSKGDMSFEEIGMVIPTIENAHDSGYTDLSEPQGHLPRVYKSHLWYRDCPKGAGKYIYVIRDPLNVAVSYYNFFNGWFFEKDTISMDEFVVEFFAARGLPQTSMNNASYWHNLTSWYPHRKDENVLWMHYEDLMDDLPACVDMISQFLGIGVRDEELKAKTVHQASFDFMKVNASKFDSHNLKEARNEVCGLPRGAGLSSSKVMTGGRGVKVQLSDATKEVLRAKWESVVQPETGHACYQDLREAMRQEMQNAFVVGNEE